MSINHLIKGIIIGIAKIIPGLSGAVLMISFNLYDKAIWAITHFFEQPKKSFVFLVNLGIGIVLGVVLFSKIVYYFISNYYLYTTSLFLGLIMGGIPVIFKRVPRRKKYFLLMFLAFGLMFSLSFLKTGQEYVMKNTYVDFLAFFVAGLLEAVGTVLPGISSTALLMLMGMYHHYLVILSGALNFHYFMDTLRFLIPFSLGMVSGIIGISILVNYLFCFYRRQTFALILGVSMASILMLFSQVIPYMVGIKEIIISFVMVLIGYFITYKLE